MSTNAVASRMILLTRWRDDSIGCGKLDRRAAAVTLENDLLASLGEHPDRPPVWLDTQSEVLHGHRTVVRLGPVCQVIKAPFCSRRGRLALGFRAEQDLARERLDRAVGAVAFVGGCRVSPG